MTSARCEEAFGVLYRELMQRGSPEWVLAALRELANDGPKGMDGRPGGRLGNRTANALLDSLDSVAAAVRNGHRATIADDWHRYNEAVVGARNARIVGLCLGLHANRMTQVEVAEREGITRQRVSQIIRQYERYARSWKPPLVTLAIVEAAARRCGRIVTALEWNQSLPQWLRAPSAVDLRVVSILLDYGWLSGLECSPQEGVWFGVEGESPEEVEVFKLEFDRVRQFVSRQLGRTGAVQMERLSKRFGEDGAGLAHAIIHDRTGVEDVDGWLLPRAPRNSVLVDRAKRILSIVPSIHINQLKAQIARAVKACPPHHIVGRILARDLDLRATPQGQVDATHLNLESASLLSPGELAALRILREERVLTARGFQKAMVAAEFSASLANVLAGRSVVLTRPRTGYLSAVDCELTEADFIRLQEVGGDERIMLGHRNLPNGGLELHYRIDPELLATTSLGLPAGRLETGSWSVTDQDGALEVHRTYFTGWRDWIPPQIGNKVKILIVSFFTESKTASLRVIG